MNIIFFGHRGLPNKYPENSISGFREIKNTPVKGIELDVHLTRDEELVVIHDFNTKKMTGKDYFIDEHYHLELTSLEIGQGERIPLFSQVLKEVSEDILLDIEVKSRGKNRKRTAEVLYKTLKENNRTSNYFISSFDPFLIRRVKKVFKKSGIKTGVIYSNTRDVPLFLRSGLGVLISGSEIIKPHHKQLKGFLYNFYTRILKKTCYTWTVNTPDEMYNAIKNGAKGICSNNPIELFMELKGKEK